MPNNDPYQNSPHLEPLLAVADGSHPPRIGQHETSSAIALEQHIQDGDLGAVRRFLHDAEHRLGPFRPDPWALLEHLAVKRALALGDHPEPAVAPSLAAIEAAPLEGTVLERAERPAVAGASQSAAITSGPAVPELPPGATR